MTQATDIVPRPTSGIGQWDVEADVVIVGFGAGGAAAAIESATAGADVVVLERTGAGGGAAAYSGGFVYLGGGTPIQRECGYSDTPDEMYKYLTAAMGPGVDDAKILTYCENSVEHFKWLVSQGVPFAARFYDEPCWEPPEGYGLMYTGGENAAPFKELATPAPRGHIPVVTNPDPIERRMGGSVLMDHLIRAATDACSEIITGAKVNNLIVTPGGKVDGVLARHLGTELSVRARGAVILTAGGFGGNNKMTDEHTPWLRDTRGYYEVHDGGAILMAQALGAGTRHMDAAEIGARGDPRLLAQGIVVNGAGQRFVNEDTYPGRVTQLIAQKQDGLAYLIVDEEALADPKYSKSRMDTPKWASETAIEIERELNLPQGSLETSIALYNRYADEHIDHAFDKDPKWLRPLRPPYGAFDLSGNYQGFTLGGLSTTINGEVRHVSGNPIPGLYAAGRAASGVPARGYASGMSLGDSTFFGRRAGRAAAEQSS